MACSILSSRLVTLTTWLLVLTQLTFILLDMVGGHTTTLLTIAFLNVLAISTFVLGFCVDLILFLLPVLVSSSLTAWFLWYRIAELMQIMNKAGRTSSGWV